MSCQAIGKVFEMDKTALDPYECLVLMSLAWHEKDGECFPSDETIMLDSGIRSRTTLWKFRNMLIKRGLIKADLSRKTRRGNGHNYQLLLDSHNRQNSPDNPGDYVHTGEHIETPQSVHTGEHIGAESVHQSVHQYVHQSVHAGEHDSRIVDRKDSVCVDAHTLSEENLETEIRELGGKGIPRSFSRHCIERWNADGGKAGKVTVTKSNFVSRVMAWWEAERNQERYADPSPTVKQQPKPCSWVLCEERCANFQNGRCILGANVSPESYPGRPHPPEDCPNFNSINERISA